MAAILPIGLGFYPIHSFVVCFAMLGCGIQSTADAGSSILLTCKWDVVGSVLTGAQGDTVSVCAVCVALYGLLLSWSSVEAEGPKS